MAKNIKIAGKDIEFAAGLCEALDECPIRDRENCLFIAPVKDIPCLDCPILNLKTGLAENAEPFLEAYQRLLARMNLTLPAKNDAVLHLLFGLGALYSANGEKIPSISLAFIQKINAEFQRDPAGYLNGVVSDLKNLGSEWYGMFFATYEKLRLSHTVWLYNIVLLKIFLEAIKSGADDGKKPDPKKSREPIKPWGSKEETEEFLKTVENFMREARKKSNLEEK